MRSLHGRWVHRRRVRVLSALLADLVPPGAAVLDVGCGDGMIGRLIAQMSPTVIVRGLEVAPRPSCMIECTGFDGVGMPFPDASFDVCLFVDVLHHTTNIAGLLREARRVTRRYVLIKDHVCESKFDRALLSFMDWVGNRAHGVSLPYNYQSKVQWHQILYACGLRAVSWNEALALYPPPFDLLFGRGLHFAGLCEKT
ncbi:MAG TPA: class I SAM-dependent methyltransferase [Terriglobia bacterium]|nr:class I SAM-dependent methyltransferase [Terriglobia bacterium]